MPLWARHEGREGVAPAILNLGARWRWVADASCSTALILAKDPPVPRLDALIKM